ncbi:MAG: cation diffusion facilitator family transporter [Muribaculaceae bacterium]|nr:cation diffusion facilitator family transporter [Muribaculaceae bacterium]
MENHHEHSHEHNHAHHHHHHHTFTRVSKVLIWGIVLNLLYVIIEGGVGIYAGSMGLVSDAGHNLSDVFSLVLTLIGIKLALAHANSRFTYGYQKATIMISLLNAIILLVAVGVIIVESIRKFTHPEPIDGDIVSWTAGVGIVINGLTAWMLMKDQKEDLNIRGAFLHMAADTLVSIGVVIAGIVITLTGWVMIDPVISLIIALLILISTWEMLKETLKLSIDGVPEGIDIEDLKAKIESIPHIKSIHHIHVWALSTTTNAITLHVLIDRRDYEDEVKAQIKNLVAEAGITLPTIEFETTPCGWENTYGK